MKEKRAILSFSDAFAHNYEVAILESYSLVHPAELLHHFPAQLEESDRVGLYLRVSPNTAAAWIGFFALGFESSQVAGGVYSCPDPDWLCAVAGGYAYVVNASDPQKWMQIEQRPVVEVRPAPELRLLVFIGLTSITVLGQAQRICTSERLSWEGISIQGIEGAILRGAGWDAVTNAEVRFELDLLTMKSRGGARPGVDGQQLKAKVITDHG